MKKAKRVQLTCFCIVLKISNSVSTACDWYCLGQLTTAEVSPSKRRYHTLMVDEQKLAGMISGLKKHQSPKETPRIVLLQERVVVI